MRVKRPRPFVVRRAPGRPRQARVALPGKVLAAAIGRGSVRALKREGDGGTPLGRFPVRQVLYRPDRIPRPRTAVPVRAIRPNDGWCDDPRDRNYNRLIRLPSQRSAEGLMREDALYDLVLVLGYNDLPRVRGKGSAIFIHVARPGYTPTEGCVALTKRDLTTVLVALKPDATVLIER